jgi:uncharacterized membrane protein YfcA
MAFGFEDILFFILALLCEIIGTLSGFGSSVFFVPLAGLFYPHHEVLFITSFLHLFSNMFKLWFFRASIRWDLTLKFGIPAVLFTICGAWLSEYVDNRLAQLLLGIFLIFFSVFMMIFIQFRLRKDMTNVISTGSLSGFIAGIAGTGGAIRGLGLMAFDLEKNLFVGTSAAIDMGVDFSRFWIYIANGFYNSKVYILFPMLLAASWIGTYVGKRLLDRVTQANFRRIVLYLILGIGIYLMGRYFYEAAYSGA